MERREARKLFLVVSLALVFALISCDDITKTPTDPHAPAELLQGKDASAEPQPVNEITIQKMITIYNLVLNTRNGLQKFYVQLEPLMQSKDPMFNVKYTEFKDWLKNQVKMLDLREEEISLSTKELGNDHPAAPLLIAIRAEKSMIEYYSYHFQLQRPLSPELKDLNKRIDDQLQEFQQRIKTWTGLPEKKQAPVVQQ